MSACPALNGRILSEQMFCAIESLEKKQFYFDYESFSTTKHVLMFV